MHWFLHLIGADNTSGLQYGFWSGFGSDIGEFVLIGGVIGAYRKHNCHVKGCWRIGLHPVEGTPYITCRKHHPSIPSKVTSEHISLMHHKYMKEK